MRSSGILMHITSLPGPYGIGTLGRQAYGFVDFLHKAGQSCWQLLPITPTGFGDSPYQSCSTYAGNPYLIDLDLLLESGLLKAEDLEGIRWCAREDKVDFGLQYGIRLKVLRKAWSRFTDREALDAFCRENRSWLPDFALFMALKDFYNGKPWYEWPEGVKFRRKKDLFRVSQLLAEEIRFYSFAQYLFHSQWQALRRYAAEKGIRIIGDVPIYVPRDSVEVWKAPQLFQLDGNLEPTAVAGCPPDAFAQDGQLWGNPLYRWDVMERNGFAWWIDRLSAAGKWYDSVRIDHFRGLEAYWSVPFGDRTARNGQWVKGPGMVFIRALKKALPEMDMIAEDLGYLTQEVRDMRDASGYPGMKVLQFAFDSREPSDYLPHTYTPNTVCYTGTHDNMTMRQWFDTASPEAVTYAAEYLTLSEEEGYVWGAIRSAFACVSDLCIIPMQDFLDLDGAARMNFPGTLSDSNWTWRVKDDIINDTLARKIYGLTKLYARLDNQK